MVFTFMPIYTYYLAQLNLQAVEMICDERCDQDRVYVNFPEGKGET